MQYISKRHLIVLMVIIVVLGVMLLMGERFAQPQQAKQDQSRDMLPPTQVAPSGKEQLLYDDNEVQQKMTSKSFVIRPGQSRLTYTEALELYKDKVLQFNQDCQLSSASRSYNLNNEIMIDNRSSKANTFTIGSVLVAIGPYDFAFMILKEKGLSIPVNCGDKKNIANLAVQ